MYNPSLVRWISPDPYYQDASPYSAVGNNPVSNIDPDGGFHYNPYDSDWWRKLMHKRRMQSLKNLRDFGATYGYDRNEYFRSGMYKRDMELVYGLKMVWVTFRGFNDRWGERGGVWHGGYYIDNVQFDFSPGGYNGTNGRWVSDWRPDKGNSPGTWDDLFNNKDPFDYWVEKAQHALLGELSYQLAKLNWPSGEGKEPIRKTENNMDFDAVNDSWIMAQAAKEGPGGMSAKYPGDPPNENGNSNKTNEGGGSSVLTNFIAMSAMYITGYRMPFGAGTYHVNNAVANSLRDAPGIINARSNFYLLGKTSGEVGFGASGYYNAGGDLIEQFIGSYYYEIHLIGNNLQFKITNTSSLSSLIPHPGGYYIWPKSWNPESGPFSNFRQTYIFTEPWKK